MCCTSHYICSISTLHDLAKELDEGLSCHVEEFARELHTESSDGGDGQRYEDEEEEDEDDEEEGEDCAEGNEECVDEEEGNQS